MSVKIITFILVITLVIGTSIYLVAAERQPHMHAALKHLRAAKMELEKASHDKGGHRVEAIKLVNQVIEEVKKGIAYDNRH